MTSAPTVQVVRRKVEAEPQLEGLHPLLARIYAARGVRSLAQLEYGANGLHDVFKLSNIEAAARRLITALQRKERILIVGDFDADGATSTAVAIKALKAMGAAQLDYLVPNRFDFGYGLTPALLEVAREMRPDLIVTVDNGISSHAGVAAANAAGIDVLITDHHLPPQQLPDAVAIVNPNLPDDAFPSKNLAGVGVIFYLLVALRRLLREQGWFEQRGLPEVNMGEFLDLVALGTVADVVPLDQNNRILVEQGLRRIRSGRASAGMLAILRAAGRNYRKLAAVDLGFALGPRLNAAGRLEDMSLGIECLLTDNYGRAEQLAAELDDLNKERRLVEADMQQQALQEIASLQLDDRSLPWGLCLYDESWHQGIVGLVASRIRERVYRPVIAFAMSDEVELKGSGRSVDGLHLRDVLAWVDSRQPGLIRRFGGHAMAAGLTIKRDDLAEFQAAFDQAVKQFASEDSLRPLIVSDGSLQTTELSIETAYMLRNCGPWGKAFEEPVFDGRFTVISRQELKGGHLKFELAAERVPRVEAVAFNVAVEEWPDSGEPLHIAYTLGINDYFKQERLQLMIKCQVSENTVA